MIPKMPRWQSYVATTTDPMFTPEQCKMIIDAGHSCAPEKAKVGGGKDGVYGCGNIRLPSRHSWYHSNCPRPVLEDTGL